MKNKILFFVIFIISFISGIFVFGANYYKYGVSIEQIIFLLKFPMVGTDDNVTRTIFIESILYVILPSLLLALAITFFSNICSLLYKLYSKYFKEMLSKNSISLRLVFSICFFIISISVLDSKFKILDFVNNYFFKEYSSFYEENYKIPDVSPASNPRNLVLIFAESMESTYSSKNIPKDEKSSVYSPFGELIPNLSAFAAGGGINFSANEVVGGIYPNEGSSVTIAGITSYLCGAPLILARGGIKSRLSYYLPNATCISDILFQNHYKQVFLQGSDSNAGGHIKLFRKHHIDVLDVNYFKDIGKIAQDYNKNWGMEDSKVFAMAKDYLSKYNGKTPFAVYISTIDTHFPTGYVDKTICPDLADGYENAIRCSDRMIGDFIRYVQASKFGKNTTIVVVGDHLSMKEDFFPQDSKRFVFDLFINPHFSKKVNKNLVKNRMLTHYDISTLILDSLGFHIEFFGLGRNPLYSKTLLETYGVSEFNTLLMQPSRLYEYLWKQ